MLMRKSRTKHAARIVAPGQPDTVARQGLDLSSADGPLDSAADNDMENCLYTWTPHEKQGDPSDGRLNQLASDHPGLGDFDDLRERMAASRSGSVLGGTVMARSAHSGVGHPDGRGKTERSKPRG
jgi:hypothetical protein